MPPRIAIPMPHSADREYAERAIPQYERAVKQAGGEPVRIPLDQTPAQVRKLVERCDAVLLPGSKADVDPEIYRQRKHAKTNASDSNRYIVDELLLQNAYNMRKPILGICYGLQSLNVHRSGSLIQHIPDFLPEELRTRVNHEAGKKVSVAHEVEIAAGSRLADIIQRNIHRNHEHVTREGQRASADQVLIRNEALTPERDKITIPVNSSHHQSANVVGDHLRIVARSPDDGIIEALEGTDSNHFVLAVQWHPERSVDQDEPSRALFRALVEAARVHHRKVNEELEGVK
jgi:putative glutamine amidotransferase